MPERPDTACALLGLHGVRVCADQCRPHTGKAESALVREQYMPKRSTNQESVQMAIHHSTPAHRGGQVQDHTIGQTHTTPCCAGDKPQPDRIWSSPVLAADHAGRRRLASAEAGRGWRTDAAQTYTFFGETAMLLQMCYVEQATDAWHRQGRHITHNVNEEPHISNSVPAAVLLDMLGWPCSIDATWA